MGSWSCHLHPCSGSTSKSRGCYPSSQQGQGGGRRGIFWVLPSHLTCEQTFQAPLAPSDEAGRVRGEPRGQAASAGQGMQTWPRSSPAPSSSSSQHRAARPSTHTSPWCCKPSRGGSRGPPQATEVTGMGSVPSSPKAACHLPPPAQEGIRLSPPALQHHHPAPFPRPLPAARGQPHRRGGIVLGSQGRGGGDTVRGSPTS